MIEFKTICKQFVASMPLEDLQEFKTIIEQEIKNRPAPEPRLDTPLQYEGQVLYNGHDVESH